ncbi:pantoate--beta-alanine ligase [Agaribacterium haliotis]|uniref:pantoate--beta-alanine ligase n=1 Tax=Agaribacterium haliotis TaxID=2013869 RepID=UPI000BB595AE|nr:pantoate--beta-alanine ligase [Agaribacterium haliotis]
MHVFHHIESVRKALQQARSESKRIAFVPTMGNLHEGHLALVRQAQQAADVVIVSIFVNRLQFGLNEDWDKYPRTLEQDIAKLEAVNCDMLFYPEEQEIYPNGMDEQTRVVVPTMTDVLCGASRPDHFEGVTTVVSKLFNIVQPDVAVFGLKDFQQLAVVRRMAEDLCMPVEIQAAPIAREDDGLARSSRNRYISEDERPRATVLYQSLKWLKAEVDGGNLAFRELEQEAKARIEAQGFRVDYLKLCEAHSLEPAAEDDAELCVLGAMYTSAARLIDNIAFSRALTEQEL